MPYLNMILFYRDDDKIRVANTIADFPYDEGEISMDDVVEYQYGDEIFTDECYSAPHGKLFVTLYSSMNRSGGWYSWDRICRAYANAVSALDYAETCFDCEHSRAEYDADSEFACPGSDCRCKERFDADMANDGCFLFTTSIDNIIIKTFSVGTGSDPVP
jgi:hypothetical protein